MRIVQVANFYTPASGGLRTCVDEIGRGYLAAGHDRVLVVPGLSDADVLTSSGRRITVRGRRFGAAGYHVLTSARTLPILESVGPEVLECSDKLSMRWLAPWARRNGIPVVLFSHERIDAILRTRVPPGFPLVTAADLANRQLAARAEHIVVTSGFAAAEFTRIGAANVRRIPLGVDLHTFRPIDPGVFGAVGGRGYTTTIAPVSRSTPVVQPSALPRKGSSTTHSACHRAQRTRWLPRIVRPSRASNTASGPGEIHLPNRSGRTPVDCTGHSSADPAASARHLGRSAPWNSSPNALPHWQFHSAQHYPNSTVQLVMVSRLSREKCPDRAIDAVRLLCDSGIRVRLTVVGDGPLREGLQRQSADLPVTFRGYVADRNLVAATLANADIALCPSPAETFGLAVLEALACGTPVVVPRDGAARELLGPAGSGVDCDGTPAGLADGVRTLLTHPADRRRQAARRSAERFSWSITVSGMLALYADLEPGAISSGPREKRIRAPRTDFTTPGR
ncbi:glycosyltransferase [Nocardia sp. CA-120079]|uniref:glycosyltransferase n=1 Tax=Nocardia sp. CA-120079 TaxID=3239974 RepID=UPI003D950E9E